MDSESGELVRPKDVKTVSESVLGVSSMRIFAGIFASDTLIVSPLLLASNSPQLLYKSDSMTIQTWDHRQE